MLPMKALRLAIGTSLASTAPLNATPNGPEVALVLADFTEDEDLTTGDLTLAAGGGLDAIPNDPGTQETGIDPVTGEQVLTIKEPLGGWHWISSGGAGYPKTVFGYALTATGGGTLLAVHRLPKPIGLTADGEYVDIGAAEMRFVLQPAS